MNGQRPEDAAAARRLGEALRALQRNSGRTLRALETQVRISDSSLSRYFRGETVPPWPVVRDLCRALGADTSVYWALWETADRGRLEEPASAALLPKPSLTWRRRLCKRLSRPWGFVAAGAAIGLAAGLALFALQYSPAAPPARDGTEATSAWSGYGYAGVLVNNVEEKCQKPHTHECALHLAWDPYRPYTTANSADRVWHRDLLQARCRIADGVTVTDEEGRHSSIWIQVARKGQHLWLPGVRVDPDTLVQLSVVLPRCPA
ncbi:helix-turn-helix domain-containing protein [Streptomyces sp. NPDC017638]|uniref:helix-turn-helix domain-containing protein n=1 Tax=Streptomyces sp. NPDC017638 TaxID=3365004 RepID=UPI00378C7753